MIGPEGEKYSYGFSYKESKDEYQRYIAMTDEEFFHPDNLIAALHFACFIGWVKELPNEILLSDVGLIHMLVHQLHIGYDPSVIEERPLVRERFNQFLELK